jgi:hypothetical protein
MNDDYVMPFGRYKGQPIEDVPVDYLQWLSRRELYGRLKVEVERILTGKSVEPTTDEQVAELFSGSDCLSAEQERADRFKREE